MISDTSQHAVPPAEPHVQGSASSLPPSTPQTPKSVSNLNTLPVLETFTPSDAVLPPSAEPARELVEPNLQRMHEGDSAVLDRDEQAQGHGHGHGHIVEGTQPLSRNDEADGKPPGSSSLVHVETNEGGVAEQATTGEGEPAMDQELDWAAPARALGTEVLSTGGMEEGFDVHAPNLPVAEPEPLSPTPWEHIEPPENRRGLAGVVETPQKKTPNAIPHSSYYIGPPGTDSCYFTPPMGQIGLHHPREILRVERDYTGGELIQFAAAYPIEFDGRITPTQFLETINAINELLISAHSLRHSFFENLLAVATLQLSRLFFRTHYEREMKRLERLIGDLNAELYNPVGLNILWPRKVAFLFLEIEYY